MVGILIVTHGKLAQELVETTRIIVGKNVENIVPITVDWNDDMSDIQKTISSAISKVDQGNGVLILTDMFGGTPSNISLSFLSDKVEIITGVNLPMLIKIVNVGDRFSLKELAQMIHEQGKKSIYLASEILSLKQ
ncbi:PTS sugar transporter subunit IIA [bacterium]|jgi:PTS system mannose-specific IIA component|nr:PTS sugar transporter subunit IIA [bacterium]MCI0613526.1 PTS sugar transporter subunit IIA [bacterium]